MNKSGKKNVAGFETTRMAFAGGLLGLGKQLDGPEAAVGPFLRQGSATAFSLWVSLIAVSYSVAPTDSFERLEGIERNANIVVLILLLYSNLSRVMHLVVRDKSFVFVNTGVMVGSLTVQTIAIVSISLMIFLPTPVVVDPVTGIRSHLVRWAEWTSLAFLMTFLTESVDLPSKRQTSENPRKSCAIAWAHGIAIGLSTSAGAILAFCRTWREWLVVFTISWVLFCSLFIRLFQRYNRLKDTKKGVSVGEKEDYERALYSLKTITVCTVAWTALAISWSFVALLSPLAAPGSLFANDSLVLVTESVFEIISKVWYSTLLLEIHKMVFDDASRTKRRLEELRTFMATVWETSSDIMIWCSEENGRIDAIISPSLFALHVPGSEVKIGSTRSGTTLLLEVDQSGDGTYRTFPINLSTPITRKQAVAALSSTTHNSRGRIPLHGSVYHKNISALVELLQGVYSCDKKGETMVLTTLYTGKGSDQPELRWEANITKLDSTCLVVLRDISERFQRFETEKKLIQEITARRKDAEANRFTRHEVKNGILAAIGVLDSMRERPSSSSPCDDSEDEMQRETADLLLAELDLDRFSYEDSIGELDCTLRDVLDTVMDHAMSREVIYEEYEIRKERVNVPEIIANIWRQNGTSHHSRFTVESEPADFPILGLDPRLLRYIYQNALSNASRYGKADGKIDTYLYYDEGAKIFRLEVVNLPGPMHESLLRLDSGAVFEQGRRLHSQASEAGTMSGSNSSGDGAWIMKKCATVLKGSCDIRFDVNRTVFSFWCPARMFSNSINDSGTQQMLSTLPPDVWGVVIDDSKIQRKLMDRFLKATGVEKGKRVMLGKDSAEIYGFTDHVMELVRSNPADRFLVIADENLEVTEGAALHGTVSGSKCLQELLERLSASDERRVLGLVRSANDSAKDVEMYRSRARGYLLKAPIQKGSVMKEIEPWWSARFPSNPNCGDSSLQRMRADSWSTTDSNYDPFYDIKASLEVVDALCTSSGKNSSLRKRWRSIKDRLHTLKGDLKTLVPSSAAGGGMKTTLDDEFSVLLEDIDTLLRGAFPNDLEKQWSVLSLRINGVIDSRRVS